MKKNFIVAGLAAAVVGALSSGIYYIGHKQVDFNRSPAGVQGYNDHDDDHDRDHHHKDHHGKCSQQVTTLLSNPPTQALTCVFHAPGFAQSTITYDPSSGTAVTTTGNPPSVQTYTSVTVSTGQPPYSTSGLTFVVFGDVPIFSVMKDSGDGYFLATWGSVPGGPTGVQNAGVCTVSSDCHCDEVEHKNHRKCCHDSGDKEDD
jgi:hypothetical protein